MKKKTVCIEWNFLQNCRSNQEKYLFNKKINVFFKVPLPQLGFEEPERICDDCLDVTSLVTKSRSLQMVRIVTVEPVL